MVTVDTVYLQCTNCAILCATEIRIIYVTVSDIIYRCLYFTVTMVTYSIKPISRYCNEHQFVVVKLDSILVTIDHYYLSGRTSRVRRSINY